MEPVAFSAIVMTMSIFGGMALNKHLCPAALAFEADFVFVAQGCVVLFAAHRTSKLGHTKL
jgi:ABC-type enterochelin transport system permease subunit